MADYSVQGIKTIRCIQGHLFDAPFQTTVAQCPICGKYVIVFFRGVVKDKYGNYTPYQT